MAVGWSTVTFRATAGASAGTPPAPPTASRRVSPGPSATPPRPRRVSIRRAGTTPSKPAANQPMTSTMTWVVPNAFRTDTCLAPSATTTRLATVWSATMLRLDVSGAGVPCGQIVRKLVVLGWVTVTLRATATALGGHAHTGQRQVAHLAGTEGGATLGRPAAGVHDPHGGDGVEAASPA